MPEIYIIYSMQRSGHHAIIFWLLENMGGFNRNMNTNVYWNENKAIYYYNDCNHVPYILSNTYKKLILSFEDIDLSNNYYNYIHNQKKLNLIPNDGDKKIIIIRDFYNMLASRYKKFSPNYGFNKYYLLDIDDIILLWKHEAREILENKNIIGILYNKWIIDKNYRNEIGDKLGIKNIFDKIDYVPIMGNGSSFCKLNLENNKINYLERFKKVKFPEDILIKIKNDKELFQLNNQLFDKNFEEEFDLI